MIQQIACHYLILNLLLAMGYLSINLLSRITLNNLITFKQQLKISRFLLLYIPCVYFGILLAKTYVFPEHSFIFTLPTIDLSVAKNMVDTTLNTTMANNISASALKITKQSNISDIFSSLLLALITIIFSVKITQYISQVARLKRIINESIVIKQHRSLCILISEQAYIPFCFSYLQRSYIVISSELLENHQHYLLAIKHELQHIRQKDTLWVYLFGLFKIVF